MRINISMRINIVIGQPYHTIGQPYHTIGQPYHSLAEILVVFGEPWLSYCIHCYD